jgi:uroporphyrinogen-III synthase
MMRTGLRPSLAGRVIMVTRPRSEAGELAGALRARGARPLLVPTIRIVPAPAAPLERAVGGLARGDYAWVIFTSRAGVRAVARAMAAADLTPRVLRARVAAIGEGTAAALRALGMEPALVPRTFTTEALAAAMPSGTGRVLLARADIAPVGLEPALAAKGWTPERVDAYRTQVATRLPAPAARALRDGPLDAVTFTSASTVRGFVSAAGDLMGEWRRGVRVVCIGPVTAAEVRASGLPVHAVGSPHTIEGLVEALERTLGPATLDRREDQAQR